MSSSIHDIEKGADLVIKAIGENVQGFLKEPDADNTHQSTNADKNRAISSLRALSRWQLENQILVFGKDANDAPTYSIDADAIQNLSPENVAKGAGLYKDTLSKQMPIMSDLAASGRRGYVEYIGAVHQNVDDLLQTPVQRPTEASMDNVIRASLGFVEAAYVSGKEEPVPGVTSLDIESLTESLKNAGYLVPGENPDRTTPLAEQRTRGTYEQKASIYEQASTMASNMELPDTVRGFGPEMAGKALVGAVENIEIQETPVFGNKSLSGKVSKDSEFTKEDYAATLADLLVMAQIVNNAEPYHDGRSETPLVQIKPSFTTVDANGKEEFHPNIFDYLQDHLAEQEDSGRADMIRRGANRNLNSDVYVPDLSENPTVKANIFGMLRDASREAKLLLADVEDYQNYQIDPDAGALSLGGVTEKAKDPEEGEFDKTIDLDADETEAEEEGYVSSNSQTERMAENYLKSRKIVLPEDEMVVVSEAHLEKMAKAIQSLNASGALGIFMELSEKDPKLIARDQAVFNNSTDITYDSYASSTQEGQAKDVTDNDKEHQDLYTMGYVKSRGPDFERNLVEKQRALKILPGEQLIKGRPYHLSSPQTAARYVGNYINDVMVNGDRKEKGQIGALLRQAAHRPIITTFSQEAQVWRDTGTLYVEATSRADKAKALVAQEKAGLTVASIPREDLERASKTLQESGSNDMIRVSIGKKDVITLTHNEAPALVANVNSMAEPLEQEIGKNRAKQALMHPSAITAALAEMGPTEKSARLIISGESVVGLTGEIKQKQVERVKAPKFDERAPDVL